MVYVFSAPLVLGVMAQGDKMPVVLKALGGSVAASWMQAIGSVVAIGVAIWLGQRQKDAVVEAERRSRFTEKSDQVQALLVLANHAYEIAQLAVPGVDDEWTGYMPSHFRAIREDLESIPLTQHIDSKLVKAMLDLRIAMSGFEWAYGASFDQDPEDQGDPDRFAECMSQRIEGISEARDAIERSLERILKTADANPI